MLILYTFNLLKQLFLLLLVNYEDNTLFIFKELKK